MSKVNQQDIDKLIELVGGRDNIATVSHCITRLRFVLNNPAIAKPKEIEQLRMVKGCFYQRRSVPGGDRYRGWRLL
ncbi:PTS system protein [Klebsiella oxytoca]|nr:PTS system protein [Klebsiella oxytoca]